MMNMWVEQHETTAEVSAVNLTDNKINLPCRKRKKIVGKTRRETEAPDTRCDEALLLDGTDNDAVISYHDKIKRYLTN